MRWAFTLFGLLLIQGCAASPGEGPVAAARPIDGSQRAHQMLTAVLSPTGGGIENAGPRDLQARLDAYGPYELTHVSAVETAPAACTVFIPHRRKVACP